MSPIDVKLPREEVEKILASYIADYRATAAILPFNVEHEQWDIFVRHLDTQAMLGVRMQLCVNALANALKPGDWVAVIDDSDCGCGIGGPGYLWQIDGEPIDRPDLWRLKGVTAPYFKSTFRRATPAEIAKGNPKRA